MRILTSNVGYGTNAAGTQGFKIDSYRNVIDVMLCDGSTADEVDIVSPPDTNWHTATVVGKSGTYKVFCDGVLIGTKTKGAINNVSELQFGRGGSYGGNRSGDGYVKNYVVENVAWGDEYVRLYHTQMMKTLL